MIYADILSVETLNSENKRLPLLLAGCAEKGNNNKDYYKEKDILYPFYMPEYKMYYEQDKILYS